MKFRLLIAGLLSTFCLHGQKPKGFDFQEACFRNPSLPYCAMRDFVIKPPKGKTTQDGGYASANAAQVTTDAAGIDWRFADPSADTLSALNCSKLTEASLAHSVIEQLSSSQGLNAADAQNVFRALSGVKEVALSAHAGSIVIMVTGRPADAILPAVPAGWKSASLSGGALLIGPAADVDQASQRLKTDSVLGDFQQAAQSRPAESDFWVAGSANLAGQQAVSAGVKRFQLTASLQDRLITETIFGFDETPDPAAMGVWMKSLGQAELNGDTVRATVSMDLEDARNHLTQLAAGPLGQGLGAFVQSARHLPVRDSATTVHTKPVIYGLDDGPREAK